jgi:hypothetical protein
MKGSKYSSLSAFTAPGTRLADCQAENDVSSKQMVVMGTDTLQPEIDPRKLTIFIRGNYAQ